MLESGSMALHRDIYWVGRQWAVTGFGVQAVDQRLKGAFDIEASQVWDDGLEVRMRRHSWVNADDFGTALMRARQRFPEPAKNSLPPVDSTLELIQPPTAVAERQPTPCCEDGSSRQPAEKTAPAERPQTVSPQLQLRVQGRLARFVPQWRVRR